MVSNVHFGAATAVGRRRINEDSFLICPPLFAVADGMGGHAAGDVASSIAVETLRTHASVEMSTDTVLAALNAANTAIIAAAARLDDASGMGTTVTGLAVLETSGGSHLMVFNVGDSRVYRAAAGRLEQVTIDHSEVQEMVAVGALSRELARAHPRRNVVTRALGTDPAPIADHWLLPAQASERFLLCSDGLFNELDDARILGLLEDDDPQSAAAALVTAADAAGGHDNITVVVVDVCNAADETASDDTTPRHRLPRLS